MSHVVPERIPALTIWQPWATLIMEGLKPFEFRRWPAPARLQGRRIAIHAGARPARKSEIADLLLRLRTDAGRGTGLRPIAEAIALVERFHLAPLSLPLASVLGTAVLGHPVKAAALAGPQDSDRVDRRSPAGVVVPVRVRRRDHGGAKKVAASAVDRSSAQA